MKKSQRGRNPKIMNPYRSKKNDITKDIKKYIKSQPDQNRSWNQIYKKKKEIDR